MPMARPEQLSEEIAELRSRLDEANANLNSIRLGQVDAMIGPQGVVTLGGAEKPYRVFFEAMNEGGLTLDTAGRILHANTQMATLLGVAIEDLRGTVILEWVATSDRFRLPALLNSKVPAQARVSLLARRTAKFPVLLAMTPLDMPGQPMVCLVVSDQREHDAIETERLENETFNRAILDSVGSEIAVLSPDGTIIATNEAWQTFSAANRDPGGPAEPNTCVGVNYLQVCRASTGASSTGALAACQGIQAVLDRRLPNFIQEYPCHSRDQERWFSMNVTPLGLGGQGVVVAHTNITSVMLATEEKANLLSQLQQSQKMESMGLLAGGIAHDMNNVLAVILGLASVHTQTEPLDSHARQAFDIIAKAANRGGDMVKGLLHFARKHPAEERVVDFNRIIEDEADLLRSTTLAKVRIRLELAGDLQPIRGDGGALANIIMNLCVNAVDAMAKDGVLTLRSRNLEPDRIEIQVQDTGSGMTREVLDNAIYPFFTTKTQGKGTGLGLSMAFNTVKAHGGQMQIESEPGEGTCVRLQFPACLPRTLPSLAPPALEQAAVGKLAVFLIDDDEMVRSATQMVLEFLDHQVTPAPSGEAAIAAVEAGFRPDLVVLDMNMPGLGGHGTLPRLRALLPEVPILVSTGRVDQDALDLVAAYPRVFLLSKPFTIDEVRSKFSLALGHR